LQVVDQEITKTFVANGPQQQGKRLAYVMDPMPDSAWDRLDPPDDAVLELTPIRLSAIGVRNLAEARSPERQARDEEALASLRAELAELDPPLRVNGLGDITPILGH